jgi:hypothetical protein
MCAGATKVRLGDCRCRDVTLTDVAAGEVVRDAVLAHDSVYCGDDQRSLSLWRSIDSTSRTARDAEEQKVQGQKADGQAPPELIARAPRTSQRRAAPSHPLVPTRAPCGHEHLAVHAPGQASRDAEPASGVPLRSPLSALPVRPRPRIVGSRPGRVRNELLEVDVGPATMGAQNVAVAKAEAREPSEDTVATAPRDRF